MDLDNATLDLIEQYYGDRIQHWLAEMFEANRQVSFDGLADKGIYYSGSILGQDEGIPPLLEAPLADRYCILRAAPTCAAFQAYSRIWALSKLTPPTATGTPIGDPAPSEPRANELLLNILLRSLSWLHLLKVWSLRQTRSGSHHRNSAHFKESTKCRILPPCVYERSSCCDRVLALEPCAGSRFTVTHAVRSFWKLLLTY